MKLSINGTWISTRFRCDNTGYWSINESIECVHCLLSFSRTELISTRLQRMRLKVAEWINSGRMGPATFRRFSARWGHRMRVVALIPFLLSSKRCPWTPKNTHLDTHTNRKCMTITTMNYQFSGGEMNWFMRRILTIF